MKQLNEVEEMNPRGKFVNFRSTIERSRTGTRRIQFIILISLKKFFYFNFHNKRCSEASHFKVGYLMSFSNLEVSEIIS